MPVNDFEKNVQEQMKELKLPPSAEVWQKVEHRIREKKKRRIIIWFLLPALLLSGGIVYWGLLLPNDKTISLNEKKPVDKLDPVNKETQPTKNENTVTINNKIIDNPAPDQGNINNSIQPNRPLIEKKFRDRNIDKRELKENVFHAEQKEPVSSEIKAADPVIRSESKKEVIIENKITSKEKKNDAEKILNEEKRDTVNNTKTEPKNDILLNKEAINTTINLVAADSNRIELAKGKKDKKISSKRTQWGFAISTGISNTPNVSDLFNFSPVMYFDASSQYGGAGPGARSSSKLRPGISLGLSFFGRQKISDRLRLDVEAGYAYLSTRIKVGNQVNGPAMVNNSFPINSYYRPAGVDSVKNFTNQYHLLSIAAVLSWRIIDRKKIDVSWDNGFGISHLFASNVLHYTGSLPGYYKNPGLLNKTHLFVSTGLSIPVMNNEKLRMEIGPFAAYGLTPVLKNSDSLNTHFINYGIRLKFLLKAKKPVQR